MHTLAIATKLAYVDVLAVFPFESLKLANKRNNVTNNSTRGHAFQIKSGFGYMRRRCYVCRRHNHILYDARLNDTLSELMR